MSDARRYRVGIDVGGTFTDFVLADATTGQRWREKCLTTPQDPLIGITTGLERLLAARKLRFADLSGIAHATTLVTNTLIERKGACTGLLTTEGFRDLLELGSDLRYDMYDLAIEFPAPLVARAHRVGIRERVDADGTRIVQPDPAEVRNQVALLVQAGVQSIAVCFLHSYRNPDHERMAGDAIKEAFPGLDVSLSSAVAPEIREYERTVTVVANAYVKPIARSYLHRFEEAIGRAGATAPILVMLSNGGMTTPAHAGEVPIRAVESGPAAGVLSACHTGGVLGERDLLAFDMGGTTAKACFVDDARPAFTGTFEAARMKRQFRGSGLPLKVPSIDMIEIGAGGGSIAAVDSTGLLKVGPQSAGANPGPVCYGLGGTHPTVTDADLLLGCLDPAYFLGGDMPLDIAAAQRAMASLAAQCGLAPREVAAGISDVVNQNMATAIRIHAAERGKDHRRYALLASGGAGPVHAYEVARILGLRRVICPFGAGTHSALGLLTAPIAIDLSRSYNAPVDRLDWPYLNNLFREMENEASQMLRHAGVESPTMTRMADMRFAGQGFELLVAVPGGTLDASSAPAMASAFHASYRKLYDTFPGDMPIETITWRLRAAGPESTLPSRETAMPSGVAQRGTRDVYFAERKAYLTAAVYDRYALRADDAFAGPAIVEERESTVVVGPRGRVSVHPSLHLVVDIQPGPEPTGGKGAT